MCCSEQQLNKSGKSFYCEGGMCVASGCSQPDELRASNEGERKNKAKGNFIPKSDFQFFEGRVHLCQCRRINPIIHVLLKCNFFVCVYSSYFLCLLFLLRQSSFRSGLSSGSSHFPVAARRKASTSSSNATQREDRHTPVREWRQKHTKTGLPAGLQHPQMWVQHWTIQD